jgi:hypothetical protein
MTMTNQNREAAIARVVALRAKTTANGCTEAEAMAAAAKAGELMDRYSLSMSDLDIREEKCRQGQATAKQHDVQMCGSAIARFCGCKVWRNSSKGMEFFGLPHDVEVALYLVDLVKNTMDLEFKLWTKTPSYPKGQGVHGRTLRRSFNVAFAHRVVIRLKEMTAAREAAARTATGTALVVVRNAVVNEQFAKLGIRLQRGRSTRYRSHAGAMSAGAAAGDRCNITSGVNGSSTRARIAA